MFFDTNTSFLNGGFAISIIGYGLFSAFVSGPELLHRESVKADWPQECSRLIVSELRDKQPKQQAVPNIDLGGILDGVFGRGASSTFGDVIDPMQKAIDLSNEHSKQVERLNEERLRQKAQDAGSRCGCAVTMLSEHRLSLGLYAASGRLITPPMFKNLKSELVNQFQSSGCSKGG